MAHNQEISLLDLWEVLIKHKNIVFKTWAAVVASAVLYVLIAAPIYKAEIFILPPSSEDIQPLNVQVLYTEFDYTTATVYNVFFQSLRSRANQLAFYHKHNVANKLGLTVGDNENLFFETEFYDKLELNQSGKKDALLNVGSVSFEGGDAELVALWVNQYVAETARSVSLQLANDIYGVIQSLEKNTQAEIDGKLLMAKKRRLDRIARLKEALQVTASFDKLDKRIQSMAGISVNTENIPLYMLSEGALQAEINMLEARTDDAPYVQGLRDLEEDLATLGKVHVDASRIKPVFVDQAAFASPQPIKPQKVLVLILASMLGLMMGCMLVFLRNAMERKK